MSTCKTCGKWAGAHATLPGQSTDHLCHGHPMNQSHTELAARLRLMADRVIVIEDVWREQLREAAAALESPERLALTDEQIDAEAHITEFWGITLGEIFEKGARFAESHHGIGTSATKEGT